MVTEYEWEDTVHCFLSSQKMLLYLENNFLYPSFIYQISPSHQGGKNT